MEPISLAPVRMSGPSSSELTRRRQFLITERDNPVPCCAPAPIYATDSSDAAVDLSSGYVTNLASVTLNLTTTRTVIVTAITNATAAATEGEGAFTMAVFYSNDLSANVQLDSVTETLFDNQNKTFFLPTSFIPPVTGEDYTFTVRMLDSALNNGTCNNAFIYVQVT
jgi:hypothetical protein